MQYNIQRHIDQDPDHINVHWDILTICQLKCTYCYARLQYGEDWGKIASRKTIDAVLEALSRSSLNFNLGLLGGEPTLSPHYYYILERLQTFNNNNGVYVVTNGERDLTNHKKFDNLAFLFSYHPADCTDRERFINNMRSIIDQGYKCKVNIMLHHDKLQWPKIKEMYDICSKIDGLKIHPHFIYSNTSRKLFHYRKNFWEFFRFLSELPGELLYDDETKNDYQIYHEGLTNFEGWDCYNNNYEVLFDGSVARFCKPHDNAINLADDPDFFKRITKTVPMTCPFKECNCDGLLKQLKVNNAR